MAYKTIVNPIGKPLDFVNVISAESDPLSLHLDQTGTPQSIINGVPLMTTAVDGEGSGDQLVNKDYVDLAVSSLELTEFFTSTASSLSPLGGITTYVMSPTSVSATSVSSAGVATGAAVNVFNFATIAGEPHLDRLLKGIYDCHVHCFRSVSITRTVTAYFEIYKYETDTTQTLLGTSETFTCSDTATGGTPKIVHLDIATEVPLAVTDRLIIKWWVTVTGGGGANPTFTLDLGGTKDSHFSLPINPLQLSNIFIPYTGAVNNVDLGAKNVLTTGTLGAGVSTLSGNNENAAFTILNLNNNFTPLTTQTAQTSDLVFNLTQSINSVVSLHEAAKISAYKVSDWFHATTEADTNSGLKFWTTSNGTPTLQLTLSDVGLASFVGSAGFLDGKIVNLGTGNDLQLYHDGTNSYINNANGDFYMRLLAVSENQKNMYLSIAAPANNPDGAGWAGGSMTISSGAGGPSDYDTGLGGNGGTLNIISGKGGDSANDVAGNGADLNIIAGDYGTGYEGGNGGNVNITSGYGNIGGYITITAGEGYNDNGRILLKTAGATRLSIDEFGVVSFAMFGTPMQSRTLINNETGVDITSNVIKITGQSLGNTLTSFLGGVSGMTLTLIFVDTYVTITDDNTTTQDTVNLSAAFTSAANKTLTLVYVGNKWFETARSTNG